ncbi:unnamed protein product, partial [Rotaria magnacalcarata]
KNKYFLYYSDSEIPTKQSRIALGSALIDNNLFNSIPYSPPEDFIIKAVDRKF